MAEFVPKDVRDHLSVDPDSAALDRTEEELYLATKSGQLLEPDMTQKEWRKFCKAATIEETERRAGTPSSLSAKQLEILEKGGESVKSKHAKKLIAKREELIKSIRPQCVDANDDEFEKELLEGLGMTEEDFKKVDTSLGPLSDWDALEKLNKVDYFEDP